MCPVQSQRGTEGPTLLTPQAPDDRPPSDSASTSAEGSLPFSEHHCPSRSGPTCLSFLFEVGSCVALTCLLLAL